MDLQNNKAMLDRLDIFYSTVSPMLDACRRDRLKRDRHEATRFTVFDYIDPDENRLSDIIHDLLDPSGAHGQGPTFLNSFLSMIGVPQKGYGQCKVKREDVIQAHRRIDITIELDSFGIGIENKPWVFESDRQLHDYWKHLRQKYGDKCMLVYLPGDGSSPVSLSRVDLAALLAAGKFKTLAYPTDLRRWIEQCEKDCGADRVRWFLRDFAEYVGTFELADVEEEATK